MRIGLSVALGAITILFIWLTDEAWNLMTSQTALGLTVGYAILFYLAISFTLVFAFSFVITLFKG